MKKCGYCGRDNEDGALSCRECGTEFIDAMAQVARAATETDSCVPLIEESTPPTAISANPQTTGYFQFEYWLLFGIALCASGYFYMALSVVTLYILLSRLQPRADWELRMVASGFTGAYIFKIFYILSENTGPIHLLEPALVILVAVVLFFTQQRGLALVLFLYSVLGVIVQLLSALVHFKDTSPKYAIFWAVLLGLSAWLIRHWLIRAAGSRKAPEPTASSVSANN
jgi:hypothetical protein